MSEDAKIRAKLTHASLMMCQGRYKEAEELLAEALAGNPEDDSVLNQLAFAQFKQEGRTAIALDTIDAALARSPDEIAHHIVRAWILLRLERFAEAKSAACIALAANPEAADAFVVMSAISLATGKYDEAADSAREALRLQPDAELAMIHLALALHAQGKGNESSDAWRQVMSNDPENLHAHSHLGWLALGQGRVQAAITHFRQALLRSPGDTLARTGLHEATKAGSFIYRQHLMQKLGGAGNDPSGFMSKDSRGFVVKLVVFSLLLMNPASLLCMLLFFAAIALVLMIVENIANLRLLASPLTRQGLLRCERIEIWTVFTLNTLGVALIATGLTMMRNEIWLFGFASLFSAVPASRIWTNSKAVPAVGFACLAIILWIPAAVYVLELHLRDASAGRPTVHAAIMLLSLCITGVMSQLEFFYAKRFT